MTHHSMKEISSGDHSPPPGSANINVIGSHHVHEDHHSEHHDHHSEHHDHITDDHHD